ncbi:MAG TPA: hypothetical protein PLJ27_00290, partial [Polyangiaceae bacterium]|nr:hypothetical protein [Polyangiaceae bacterium]
MLGSPVGFDGEELSHPLIICWPFLHGYGHGYGHGHGHGARHTKTATVISYCSPQNASPLLSSSGQLLGVLQGGSQGPSPN